MFVHRRKIKFVINNNTMRRNKNLFHLFSSTHLQFATDDRRRVHRIPQKLLCFESCMHIYSMMVLEPSYLLVLVRVLLVLLCTVHSVRVNYDEKIVSLRSCAALSCVRVLYIINNRRREKDQRCFYYCLLLLIL